MSIFRDTSIVLEIKKIGEKNMLYTLFSKDFGKIRASKKVAKKEKAIDLGYIINAEIITGEKSNIHKIRNIKIYSEFDTNLHNKFQDIYSYLEILALLKNNTIDGEANKQLFGVISEIHQQKNLNHVQFLLIKLKLRQIFGELPEEHTNLTVQKILKFIHQNPLQKILRLTGINTDIENFLREL